ncbi:MAG TPA: tyrosine-type recombinase/integrase [Steroidobacteraceae bacterium]|nr:tyrosine-type recombinase/integrase [Steroidobacteraceae bacterium]
MGNQRTSGLTKRGGIWHIDKLFRGTRLCESTGTSDLREAQEILAERMSELLHAQLYGTREARTFRTAATKYLQEYAYKRRIMDDALHLKSLDPFIGALDLKQVHMGSLQEFINRRRQDGVKTKTINAALAVARRVLNVAADEWVDEQGMTWLERAPKIKLFPIRDARAPYPLSQEEQSLLFQELPDHLARMALFKVNTGLREQEVCGLKWDYEVRVPELETSVFVIPGEHVKNGEERLVVLNRVAKSLVEGQRGVHPVYVFAHARGQKVNPEPVTRINNTAWKAARERAADAWANRYGEPSSEGFRRVRVHDLKHTFGRRLRAAGVGFEDRQDLLGHKSGRITTHYSQAELANLIEAADKVCTTDSRKSPASTWLRRKVV